MDDTEGRDLLQPAWVEVEGRIDCAEPLSSAGSAEQKHSADEVNSPRRRARKEKAFAKLFNLGANKMVVSKLFNRATHVFMLLVRDASYGGRCYTTPALIAHELDLHATDVRKILRDLENEGMVLKIGRPGAGHYMLNPNYVTAGDDETEEVAKAIWAKERTKKLAQHEAA